MFRDLRIISFAVVGLAAALSPLYGQDSESDHLATLRRADASFFEKSIACKRLAVIGTEAAIPVLADMLDDEEKVSHMARYALEPIPSPQVDKTLVDSLQTLQGVQLVGVINSLANRGKPSAIEPLAALLSNEDPAVAAAAAHSIARLGTLRAAKLLGESITAKSAAACLVCGKTLAEQDHKSEAVALLTKVANSSAAPQHVRLAAMLQAVDIQGAAGGKMLAEAFQVDDTKTFDMALRTVRLLPAEVALSTTIAAMADAPPARKALLITVLGELGDSEALPVVLAAAKSDDIAVRIAAIRALAELGSAAHIPLLVAAAAEGPAEVTEQAHATLVALPGKEVEQMLLKLLDDPESQAVVIHVIGQRRIEAAVPRLLSLMDGPNRLEVILALGETIPLDQFDVLAKLLGSSQPEVQEAAQKAIHAACDRMPDRDAMAEELARHLNDQTAPFLMEELRLLGGDAALRLVTEAVMGNNDVLKDHASRALGEWLDISAAPSLLKLAQADGTGKYGIRGIKGYVRLARQFAMPEPDRLAMCKVALQTASRASERTLVLEVLRRYPSLEGLQMAVDLAQERELKKDATRSARAIAKKLGDTPQTEKILAKLK